MSEPSRRMLYETPGAFTLEYDRSPVRHYPEETHRSIQVCVPLPGAVYRVILHTDLGRRVVHDLGARDILVLPVAQPHEILWRREAGVVSLHLSEEFLGNTLGLRGVVLRDTCTVRDPLVSLLAGSVRDQCLAVDATNRSFAESVANIVAAHIGRSASAARGVRGGPGAPAFSAAEFGRLKRLIDDQLGEELGIASLARTLNLSHWHFMRRFYATCGMTPHQFIIETRLSRARDLLRDTNRPVTEIALDVGMTPSHFSRSFVRRFGQTPREYRRASGVQY